MGKEVEQNLPETGSEKSVREKVRNASNKISGVGRQWGKKQVLRINWKESPSQADIDAVNQILKDSKYPEITAPGQNG